MAVEARRACGYRKVGGLYLVSGSLAEPCHRLPFPLSVCPMCGAGFKPARGWTWLAPWPLFGPGACPLPFVSSHCERCVICSPSKWPRELGEDGRAKDPRAGLLWVGERFYPTPRHFEREAQTLGVSRRIPHVPQDFVLGVTWVLLAHRRALVTVRGLDTDWAPGIFHAFKPTAIEKLVKQSELTPEAVQDALKRGLTLVPVPDQDLDHQGSVYDSDAAEPSLPELNGES